MAMPRILAACATGVLLAAAAAADASPPQAPASGEAGAEAPRVVRWLTYRGVIHALATAVIERTLETAARDADALVVVELDTPGGVVDDAEEIVEAFLDSPVPVCVYVAPRGARAASAGFFLLVAADVAAMAPVTRTGAAHPIVPGGANSRENIELEKASEDLAAFLRSIAAARGRPVDLVSAGVLESRSFSAQEALEAGLIDVVASSREELLEALDGRVVRRADGTRQRLVLAPWRLVEQPYDWGEELGRLVLRPGVVTVLLLIAIAGLGIEFYNPGSIYPGAIGLAALALVLFSMQYLPVRGWGVLFLVLGLVLLVLEVKLVAYGLLGLAGIASVLAGVWLLFPAELRVSPWVLVAIGAPILAVVAWVVRLLVQAQRRRATTGIDGLLGQVGESITPLDPEGRVFVRGEGWTARATRPVGAGAPVRVVRVEGLRLVVEPADSPESGAAPPAGD